MERSSTTNRLTLDFGRRTGNGETAFDETGCVRVCWTCKAWLLTADRYLEFAWFDYCAAVICNNRKLAWLESERDDPSLTWLQMYSFDSGKRSNRHPNRCRYVSYINLHHFIAFASAGVLNRRTHGHIFCWSYASRGNVEA